MLFVYRTRDGYKMTTPVTPDTVTSGGNNWTFFSSFSCAIIGETLDAGFGFWERIA